MDRGPCFSVAWSCLVYHLIRLHFRRLSSFVPRIPFQRGYQRYGIVLLGLLIRISMTEVAAALVPLRPDLNDKTVSAD